jgi:hypothetical protein
MPDTLPPHAIAADLRAKLRSTDTLALFQDGVYLKIVAIRHGTPSDLTEAMALAFQLVQTSGPTLTPQEQADLRLTPDVWLPDLDVWGWLNQMVAARLPFAPDVQRFVRKEGAWR